MTQLQPVSLGSAANDGTGDTLRSAFTKINTSLKSLRSDISTAPRVVLLGDSMTAMNTDVGSLKNTYHGPRGFFTWLQVRLGFPFQYVVGNSGSQVTIGDNKGVGGDTTTMMLARLQADVLARNPDLVFVWAGTNDITGGANYATITGNLASIYQQLLDQGILVAVIPIMPRHPSGTDWASNNQRRLMHAVNRWILDKAQTTQGMILIDTSPRWVDPATANGDARSGYTIDGVHPSPVSAYDMADVAYQILSPLVRPVRQVAVSQADIYDATYHTGGNLISSGLLTGTSGTTGTGASGTIATGWQLFRNSGTVITLTGSKTTRTDGLPGDVQQIVASVNGAGSGTGVGYFTPNPASITAGIATNGWYEAACEISVSASSGGGSPVEGIYLELSDATTGGSKVRCLTPFTGFRFPNVAWSGVLKTPPLQLVGTTGLRVRLIAELNETVNDSVTIKTSRVTVRQCQNVPVF